MTTIQDRIMAKAATLEKQLVSAKLSDTLSHFQTKVTARWTSRRLWMTVLPILAAVFFLRGHLSEILTTVVPSAVTLLKWYLITTCVTDAVNAVCDAWNRNVLAGHVIGTTEADPMNR